MPIVEITPSAIRKLSETTFSAAGRDWRFPGKQECVFCHSRQGNFVLGFATPQLNRPGKSGEKPPS